MLNLTPFQATNTVSYDHILAPTSNNTHTVQKHNNNGVTGYISLTVPSQVASSNVLCSHRAGRVCRDHRHEKPHQREQLQIKRESCMIP